MASPLDIAIAQDDLAYARAQAATRLNDLREAEQLMRDRRGDFERARKVVNRYNKRLIRLVTGRN